MEPDKVDTTELSSEEAKKRIYSLLTTDRSGSQKKEKTSSHKRPRFEHHLPQEIMDTSPGGPPESDAFMQKAQDVIQGTPVLSTDDEVKEFWGKSALSSLVDKLPVSKSRKERERNVQRVLESNSVNTDTQGLGGENALLYFMSELEDRASKQLEEDPNHIEAKSTMGKIDKLHEIGNKLIDRLSAR